MQNSRIQQGYLCPTSRRSADKLYKQNARADSGQKRVSHLLAEVTRCFSHKVTRTRSKLHISSIAVILIGTSANGALSLLFLLLLLSLPFRFLVSGLAVLVPLPLLVLWLFSNNFSSVRLDWRCSKDVASTCGFGKWSGCSSGCRSSTILKGSVEVFVSGFPGCGGAFVFATVFLDEVLVTITKN